MENKIEVNEKKIKNELQSLIKFIENDKRRCERQPELNAKLIYKLDPAIEYFKFIEANFFQIDTLSKIKTEDFNYIIDSINNFNKSKRITNLALERLIEEMNSIVISYNPCYSLDIIYCIFNIKNNAKISGEFLGKVEHNYFDSKNKLGEIGEELEKAQLLMTQHALKGFKGLYEEESKKQQSESTKWLKSAKITVGILLISVLSCFIFNFFYKNESLLIYANEATFNLILLAISLFCAKMYSINRALEINYKHKSVSSDALMSYVEAIKDQKNDESKNIILVESSRMIFSLPETGLTNKENKLDLKLLDLIKDLNKKP